MRLTALSAAEKEKGIKAGSQSCSRMACAGSSSDRIALDLTCMLKSSEPLYHNLPLYLDKALLSVLCSFPITDIRSKYSCILFYWKYLVRLLGSCLHIQTDVLRLFTITILKQREQTESPISIFHIKIVSNS